MTSPQAESFPGLKWNHEKREKWDKYNRANPDDITFHVIQRYKMEKGVMTDKKLTSSSSTRKLSGLPRFLEAAPEDEDFIYVFSPYWVTGPAADIKSVFSTMKISPTKDTTVLRKGNYKSEEIWNNMTVLDYIAGLKRERTPVNLSDLTDLTLEDLSLMAAAVKSRSSINSVTEQEEKIVRITKTGRPLKGTGLKSPRGRAPLTPEGLWEKGNTCRQNMIRLPKKVNGQYVISDVEVSQAVNVSRMSSNGKGVKFCYTPRPAEPDSGRQRAKKLVHITTKTSKGNANILVNVTRPQGLDAYLDFMGNFLTENDKNLIRDEFSDRSQTLRLKSPSYRAKGTRLSPKSVAASRKEKVTKTIPDSYGRAVDEVNIKSRVTTSSPLSEVLAKPPAASVSAKPPAASPLAKPPAASLSATQQVETTTQPLSKKNKGLGNKGPGNKGQGQKAGLKMASRAKGLVNQPEEEE